MTFPTWPNVDYVVVTDEDYAQAEAFAGRLADAITAKPPELPPEVHNTNPVDAERAMAAVRSMCGG